MGKKMNLRYRLLDHPFYQAWNKGQVTIEQLSDYAESYKELINNIPHWWNKILTDFKIEESYSNIVEEEFSHIPLWSKWSDELPTTMQSSKMNDIIEQLDEMNTSELLGAIHAFEIQQPEVAKLKKEKLICHYGFNDEQLIYFTEHQNEQEHIDAGIKISKNYADKKSFEFGFQKGSEIFYNSLNKFL